MNPQPIPFWGARKFAQELQQQLAQKENELNAFKAEMAELGALSIIELNARKQKLESMLEQLELYHKNKGDEIQRSHEQLRETSAKIRLSEQAEHESIIASLQEKIERLQVHVVQTNEIAELQAVGVYEYQHPLQDVVSYQAALEQLKDQIKSMNRKDGGAIHAANDWTVNGSAVQGRRMVRETSKLMLRAFNVEVDHLVRSLKPYKLASAVDRVKKAASTIEDLGSTLQIRVSSQYLKLRIQELEFTADYLHKLAEEKEAEREERERLREERKAQQEMERERTRLEKERQHYTNALEALRAKGDDEAAVRMQAQLDEVARAIDDVDYRTANIRAGYVYVISNIGAFGEAMVKIGMTRRLDPMDRVRELGDASVPFNFDVHALFFSKDAVGIETAMHQHFAPQRVNKVNLRREFFQVSALQAKEKLAELAGDLLQFQDLADAIEWRESIAKASAFQASDVNAESLMKATAAA